MIGAKAAEAHHTVILAGVAGLISDALSMGSSGYLAAKSEQEVYANEIAMERDEVALMPEVERDELALIYEAKGMAPESAHALATEVMADPERMLEEQVQGELGINEPHMSPMREAWITGSATAVGALIPVFPFLIWSGTTAIVLSFTISMLSHWIGVLLATIGATLILGALAFVSTLIGGLINAMIVIVSGPLIDRLLSRRGRTAR